MTRSVWKGPFVEATLLKKAQAVADSGRKEVIKTWYVIDTYAKKLSL